MSKTKYNNDFNLTQGQVTNDSESLMTLEQASEYSKISPHTLRNWCQKEKIKYTKVKGRYGLQIKIDKNVLDKFIKDNPDLINVIKSTDSESNHTLPKDNFGVESNIELFKANLDLLQGQLIEKDKQIANLLEKLTQANSLALNAQNLAKDVQNEKAKLLEDKEITAKSKKKFFGLF